MGEGQEVRERGDKKPRPEGAEARPEHYRRISAYEMYSIREVGFSEGENSGGSKEA